MKPPQVSKKSSALAEVKEAFGLDEEEEEVLDIKPSDAAKDPPAKESKDGKVAKEKEAKEAKEPKEPKESKKHKKEPKEGKEPKAQKTEKDSSARPKEAKAEDTKEKEKDAEKEKEKDKDEDKEKDKDKAPSEAKPKAGGFSKGIAGLDFAALQKQIEEEKSKLRHFVIKAKQDWEEKGKAKGSTNEQEYYIAKFGETCGPNKEFTCEGSIGRGVFSSVYQCKHSTEDKTYAVKFIRSSAMCKKAAEKEVETYRKLAKLVPKEDQEAAQFMMFLSSVETFTHNGHLSMIFDLQKCDLRTALQKYGQGRGLPLQTVAQYVRQIFLVLRVLRKLNIIHGDLKPDNVLMSLNKTEVKVCDFGSSFEVAEQVKTCYLQPRYYRAPEVIIGTTYDTMVDLWSVGVTTYELGTGKILFQGKTNNGMLRCMLDTCGEFPSRMIKEGTYANKHFSSSGHFVFKKPDSMTGEPEVCKMRNFQKPPKPIADLVAKVLKEPPPNADNKTQERLLPRLADLVTKCIRMDPGERFTPDHALAHNFFKKDK